MAFVLKQPSSPKHKGVLMLTHKEIPYLNHGGRALNTFMQRVKEQYLIGVHYGRYAPKLKIPDTIDFIMGSPFTLNDIKTPIPKINLASRNFLPDFFATNPNQSKPKFWDILCIANNIRDKKLDEFLRCMRRVMDKRPQTKILLVTGGAKKQREPHYYANLNHDYMEMFSDEERHFFSIIDYRRDKKNLYGMGYRSMPWLMESARIFTLFSDVEGESRVIAEAILSGTPVIAKKHLKGGGLDYLNKENSALFTTEKQAADIFIKKLNQKKQWGFDQTPYIEELREDYSLRTLEQELKGVFAHYKQPYKKSALAQNLARKLPAHENILPDYLTNKFTDDLNSPAAFLVYLKETLLEEKISPAEKTILKIRMWLFSKLRGFAVYLYRQARRILRHI